MFVVVVVVVLLLCGWERVVLGDRAAFMWVGEGNFLGDQGIVEHCHYYRFGKKMSMTMQHNATQRNAIKLRHSTQSTIDGRENYFKAMFLLLLFVVFIFI